MFIVADLVSLRPLQLFYFTVSLGNLIPFGGKGYLSLHVLIYDMLDPVNCKTCTNYIHFECNRACKND